jgi:hypothetical protein
MAITLIVNNIPFDYPEQGEQAPWGEAATGWASEVTKVLNTVRGPSDVVETFVAISNNATSFLNIPSLFFDTATVRSFNVEISITRQYNPGAGFQEITETALLLGLNQGASGWVMQQESLGDVGITFDVNSSGQIQYKSTNLTGHITSWVKFKGTALLKT